MGAFPPIGWIRQARWALLGPLLGTVLGLAACDPAKEQEGTEMSPQPPSAIMTFRPVGFSSLAGWAADDHGAALAAFVRTCGKILAKDPALPLDSTTGAASAYGTAADWQAVCASARNAASARLFFETEFTPFEVVGNEGSRSLFTGYYEPEIKGSLTQGGMYQSPLLGRPSDLQTIRLDAFDPALSGHTIRGRVANGRFVPYPTRADINEGALAGLAEPVMWLADPVDAFFTHVQGSARVTLPDGEIMRVGYAGKNGRPYTAIGRVLVDRGALPREGVSMQSIRAWLAANPDEARSILEANQSYVFFNAVPIRDRKEGPVGAAGVPLTPGRSLAVDRHLHGLGAPFYLDGTVPGASSEAETMQRLMVAQDTGSAIRGPVRGDFFWGSGDAAGERAGRMQHAGRLFVLLPNALAARIPNGN